MRVPFIPHTSIMSLTSLTVGLALNLTSHGLTQGATPAAAAVPGLFPDAQPVRVEKASLRGLLDALQRRDQDRAKPMVWQMLAAMSKAREQGTGPSEFLAAGYRAERLKGSDAASVQNCLLSAWAGAQTLALFTPENIALMERGAAPLGTRGADRGKPVNLDTGNLPAIVVTTKALSPAATSLPEQTPLPSKEPTASLQTIDVKIVDVRLHDRVPLDAYGLRNVDFRLDSVDPQGSVAFLFADRTGQHFGRAEHWESPNRLNRELAFSDEVVRLKAFSPEPIPDTTKRGVKLLTLPFAAVYLDEDLGVQVTYHLVIRVIREALIYDQLPPERRKLYDIQSPP
jgi:hypothetical protein